VKSNAKSRTEQCSVQLFDANPTSSNPYWGAVNFESGVVAGGSTTGSITAAAGIGATRSGTAEVELGTTCIGMIVRAGTATGVETGAIVGVWIGAATGVAIGAIVSVGAGACVGTGVGTIGGITAGATTGSIRVGVNTGTTCGSSTRISISTRGSSTLGIDWVDVGTGSTRIGTSGNATLPAGRGCSIG
jgi:hypothetical protein